MTPQTFSHIGVCVSDLDRSTRFYTEVLGFTEMFTMDMGPEVGATMEIEGSRFRTRLLGRTDVRVELLEWADIEVTGDGRRRPMNQLGMTHLCFRVENIDDLYDAAVAVGGEVHRSTYSALDNQGAAPVELVYLTDPDGIRIECMSGSPDLAAFGPQPD